MADGAVLVLSLGGTIAMTRDGDAGGVSPQLDASDLVSAVPELDRDAEIEAESVRTIPGAELAVDDVVALAARIERAVAEGVRGVVVTQGTDTIEETAFLLDLLLAVEQPVVVTGAMRNPTLAGADGPANLLAATQVATSEVARGLGVLVVLNDEIHAARFVRKTHPSNPATFVSDPGAIGWVSEGRPRVVARPVARLGPIGAAETSDRPAVALITVALGDDGRLLRAVPSLGFAGAVLAALGGGHAPTAVADALREVCREIPVVLCSRTGRGEGLVRTYEFPGSELDLLERGAIAAGLLDPPKARLLLTLLLRAGCDQGEIRARFAAA